MASALCREMPNNSNLDTFLAPVLKALEKGEKHIHLEGLWETSKELLIALLRGQLTGNFLILAPSCELAEKLYQDLQFFVRMIHPQAAGYSVHLFPAWEILPYEAQSPLPEVVSRRIESLYALLNHPAGMVVAPVEAALQNLMPKRVFNSTVGFFGAGETIEREEIIGLLVRGGYRMVDLVEDPGDYSVRGGVLDIFPPGHSSPVRLEFFGDTIESIRQFNPSTQRSEKFLEEVIVLPVTEAILNREHCHHLSLRLRQEFGDSYLYQSKIELLQAQLDQAVPFPGLVHYIPYLYSRTDTLFQYLPADGHIFLSEPGAVQRAAEDFQNEVERRYHQVHRENLPYPPPREGYRQWTDIQQEYFPGRQVFSLRALKTATLAEIGESAPDTVSFTVKSVSGLVGKSKIMGRDRTSYLENLTSEIKSWHRKHQLIVLVCGSESQAERLEELFREYELGVRRLGEEDAVPLLSAGDEAVLPPLICLGEVSHGFYLPGLSLVLITDQEIFGERKKIPAFKGRRPAAVISTFRDLKEGDYVVHVEHGIGRYLGLKKLAVGDIRKDFMLVEYCDGDKLYIPPEKLNMVQKYSGSGGAIPKLDKLGGTSWGKTKARVKNSVKKMAEDLLKLYAARSIASGFAAPADTPWQREFEASFEYEETPDQARAIRDVKEDMEQPRPMDRLVCGDVGYGKTEVALRAAFKAITGNRQVALVAPTTILVEQHFQKFSQRLSPYPVKVEMLSRFRSRRQQQETIQGLRDGTVDVVIGTHRLLQKDIEFRNLGLVIIDEEQRFGVAHKERLKTLRSSVDVLTLTATPIPRTLNMALTGVRDLSVIDTPPADRLAIQTHIIKFDPDIITQAIIREMEREGQVFFVHNRVENIEKIADYVRGLVPSARIAVAHGQMEERQLEKIMLDFVQHKYDILVCTTIVESGLDIPAANTIIINQAHRYGLAQLYQLRGRVGRSSRRAFAYLIIPGEDALTEEARKRMVAIQELSELGSGFRLAARDMEIRGAGNLLGAEQHGQIAAVGFDLYCDLIRQAVQEMQGEPVETSLDITIDLQVEAHLPDFYVPDTNQRLNLYKRASLLENDEALKSWKEELEDRYGALPDAARLFFQHLQLRLLCQKWKVKAVHRAGDQVSFTFDERTPISPPALIQLVQKNGKVLRLSPPGDLSMTVANTHGEALMREVQDFFQVLEKAATGAEGRGERES
ncbi:MAG: transcription-repair coupling factor [bacterium]